jgi:hypothetical protein
VDVPESVPHPIDASAPSVIAPFTTARIAPPILEIAQSTSLNERSSNYDAAV